MQNNLKTLNSSHVQKLVKKTHNLRGNPEPGLSWVGLHERAAIAKWHRCLE